MILYDKNGTFLGMGQDELFVLGYEDIEEFKSYFNDFADLFVNRPGYISKFKNFSWIDYILHSGASNKNVILKQKSGREVESGLIISEMPLMQEINGSSALYCIKLGIANDSFDSQIKPNIKLPSTEEELIPKEMKKISTPIEENTEISSKKQYDEDFQEDDDILIQSYDEDYDSKIDETQKIKIDNLENEQIHLKISDDYEKRPQESDVKLKIDMDIEVDDLDLISTEENEKKEEKSLDIDDIPIMSQEFQNHIKINSEPDIGSDICSKNETITEESLAIERKEIEKEIEDVQFENIDFMQIAEETGMDLGDIASFIEDFITESKNYLENPKSSGDLLDIDFARNEAMKLRGVASNLKMENISKTLNLILKNSNREEINYLIKQLQEQIKDLQEQLF